VRVHSRHRSQAFSLIELLIATVILSAMVVLLGSLLSTVSRAWTRGEQQTSQFQDGRAVLELIGRELAQAVISPSVQFIHDPSLTNAGGTATAQRGNSDCIFWVMPATTIGSGGVAEVGYYLSEDFRNSGSEVYQLKRFFVPPSDATNYQIFSPANQPTDTAAPWVSNFVTNPALTTNVAGGILAFWARCLDRNGDPIPWATGAGGRYNSAAHFQPAIAGQSGSFKYTSAATTARANLLPSAVELVIVTLDPVSFNRNPSIPAVPAQANEHDLQNVRDSFNQQLLAKNIRTARTFSTRVQLLNSRE